MPGLVAPRPRPAGTRVRAGCRSGQLEDLAGDHDRPLEVVELLDGVDHGADVLAGAGRDEVAAAIASVAVAVEVIDSRIADWRIAVEDTVADKRLLGLRRRGRPVPVEEVGDLRTVGLVLRRIGEAAATGAGAAVLGDPVGSSVTADETMQAGIME